MQLRSTSLVAVLALALGAAVVGCSSDPDDGNNGTGGTGGAGTGGSGGAGGRGGSGTGGTSASGGSGGSTGGSSGTGGSTGGSGGAGGSTTGSGGTGGGTGGSGGSGGGPVDGGSEDTSGADTGASNDVGGGAEGGTGAKLMLTVQGLTMGQNGRMCYRPASASQGNNSPAMSWTGIPAGTKSLVLSVEDQSSPPTPHQVVCNIPPSVMDRPANVMAMLPPMAEAGYGHGNQTRWYGPGASNVRPYEIRIWALSVEKLEGGCGGGQAPTRMKFAALKAKMNDKAFVLDTDAKVFWGNAAGNCN